jgi:hypothetical protein
VAGNFIRRFDRSLLLLLLLGLGIWLRPTEEPAAQPPSKAHRRRHRPVEGRSLSIVSRAKHSLLYSWHKIFCPPVRICLQLGEQRGGEWTVAAASRAIVCRAVRRCREYHLQIANTRGARWHKPSRRRAPCRTPAPRLQRHIAAGVEDDHRPLDPLHQLELKPAKRHCMVLQILHMPQRLIVHRDEKVLCRGLLGIRNQALRAVTGEEHDRYIIGPQTLRELLDQAQHLLPCLVQPRPIAMQLHAKCGQRPGDIRRIVRWVFQPAKHPIRRIRGIPDHQRNPTILRVPGCGSQ